MNTADKIVERLVQTILGEGYSISVFDGEEFALKRSQNYETINAAMRSTGQDTLILYIVGDHNHERLGMIDLIWENGADVISDHTDSARICGLVDPILKWINDGMPADIPPKGWAVAD